LAEDPEFHKEDYLDGVFEACQHYGRQYVVPLSCELPLVASIRSDLEELGFRWDGVDTMSDLLEESVRVTPKAEVNSNFQQMFCSKNTFQRLLLFSSIPVINYETGEVLPDEKNFRDFLESYKLYFPYDYNEADRAMYHRALGYDVLTAGRCAFVFPRNMDGLPATLSVLKNESYDYVIHSIPGQTKESVGIVCGPVAINANSKNTLNAYRFIKFILSETSQKDRYTIPDGMPILKKALYDGLVNSTGFTRGPGGNAMPDYEDRAFTEDEAEMIMELITGTDRFVLNLSNEIIEMVCDTMLPFFQNEASYEFCLNDLRSKLTFYLSE